MFHKIIIDHCEETSLVAGGQMHEGVVSAELGLKGRPAAAEDIAVARDIILSEITDTPVHIAHISTKHAVDMVRRAKARGLKITAEATPQHMILTDEALRTYDPRFKSQSAASVRRTPGCRRRRSERWYHRCHRHRPCPSYMG